MISSYTVFLHDQFLLNSCSFLVSSYIRDPLWSGLPLGFFYDQFLVLAFLPLMVSSSTRVPLWSILSLCSFMISSYTFGPSWLVLTLLVLHDQFLQCVPSWSAVLALTVFLHDQFLHNSPSWSVLTLCSFKPISVVETDSTVGKSHNFPHSSSANHFPGFTLHSEMITPPPRSTLLVMHTLECVPR